MTNPQLLPLFPLGSVLLPGNTLKLHIFELRFRHLVRDCLDAGTPFGVVYYTGEQLCRIGTTARIVDIPRTWPDGRMDIVCSGRERFEIESIQESTGYSLARVQYLADADDSSAFLQDLKGRIITLLARLSESTGKPLATAYLEQMSPRKLCYLLGNTDLLEVRQRQVLLETDSLPARLGLIQDAASLTLQRMQATRQFQDSLDDRLLARHFLN